MEESDEGVDGWCEAGAKLGGDAAEELGYDIGVLIEGGAHLLHSTPDLKQFVSEVARMHLPSESKRLKVKNMPSIMGDGWLSYLYKQASKNKKPS